MTALRGEALARLEAVASGVGTDDEGRAVAAEIRALAREARASKWSPYVWQHPHHHPEGWVSETNGLPFGAGGTCDRRCGALPAATVPVHGYWLQRGGRGTGKTEGAAHYVDAHVRGPACDPRVPGGHRLTIVAPTQADAVTSCVTGPSGLQAINPGVTISTTKEGTLVRWPGGARARVVGAHNEADLNRLRAWTNVCCAWVEEAAAMTHLADVLDGLPFTLRLGSTAHSVVTTTPRNRPEVRSLIAGASVQTWGRTRDAYRLDPAVRAALEAKFAGRILGRQELDGDELESVEGALWIGHNKGDDPTEQRPGVENDRVPVEVVSWTAHTTDAAPPPAAPGALTLHRVVVGVDPSAGGDDEAGIVVVGSVGQHGYPIADLSGQMTSDTWARKAVQAYFDYGAEGIALEKSGGDNPRLIIRSVVLPDGRKGADVPLFMMPTKVGKRLRAEPVSALYEQHRVHHVGVLPRLEDQMTTWVPDEDKDSPDRVDALVHALTFLLLRSAGSTVQTPTRRRLPGR